MIRAAADLADPFPGVTRPEADRLAAALADVARDRGLWVVREVTVALGRLGWPETVNRLKPLLTKPDPALEHAAQQALRRAGNWPAVLKLLDLPDEEPVRAIALRALADRAEAVIVNGLIERL